MYLIYVNYLGVNFKGKNIYEFIFSSDTDNVDGDDWDIYPASSGNITAPPIRYIEKVGTWETDLTLNVIAKSDTFCVWDAVDGIIALAYEDVTEYSQYPEDRLSFRFGDSIEEVKDTLYSRDIILEYKDIHNEDKKE